MEGIHIASEMADPLGAAGFLGSLAAVGTIATGISFGIAGVKDMKEAVKNKNAMGMIESTGHLMVAGDAVLAVSSLLTSSAAISAVMGPSAAAVLSSPAMAAAGMVFGIGHGAAEVIVGGKEFADGIKAKEKNEAISGLLKMGIGSSIMACVMGAGLPGGIALAVLLAADISFRRDSYKQGLIEMHGAAKQALNKLKNKITPQKTSESQKNKDIDPLEVLKAGQPLNLADFPVKGQ